MRNAYKILVGKPEGKRSRGIPRRQWEDNFRMDLREKGWEGVDWSRGSQNRDLCWTPANSIMNRVP
jgi:hypothetical protein